MGGSVLEECAEENCVIVLGSKIGADYIVRGTISKFQTKITLSVELYETATGTLVVSSEPVHAENAGELFGMISGAVGNMYRKFGEIQDGKYIFGKKYDWYIAPKYQASVGTPVSWGGVNLEGGFIWGKGLFLGIDIGGGFSKFSPIHSDKDDMLFDVFGGIGLSFGNVYNFWAQAQIVYGVSVGYWEVDQWVEFEEYRDWWWDKNSAYNFFAPFVKLRWNSFELTYRGLLGYSRIWDDYNYEYKNGFNYGHQLMIGLYLATNKRPSH